MQQGYLRMSTDDSISEDVSSSVALGHENADESGGKESEASIISSEETPLGLVGPEEEHTPERPGHTLEGFIQAASGAIKSQGPPTPACSSLHKSRNLCLSAEDRLSSGRSLPSINPSPLQTLTALVQEIQSSGETDPELWKDSEGRWLQLFQLVEKQYQEQILAQQEQYQCQIQLIQDEIKALVQLQNKQSGTQPTEGLQAQRPVELPLLELLNSVAPGLPSPQTLVPPRPPQADTLEPCPEGTVLLSSGYGTLSASEHSLYGYKDSRITDRNQRRKDERPEAYLSSPDHGDLHPSVSRPGPKGLDPREGVLRGSAPGTLPSVSSATADQPKPNGGVSPGQPVTTWAQKQKRRLRKSRLGQGTPLDRLEERSSGGSPEAPDSDDYRSAAQSSHSFYLRRSDSSVSEASGLTYWRLDENELYHPLPDSLDSDTYHLLKETSANLTPSEEPKLSVSLREIYRTKQKEDTKRHNREISNNSTSTTQVLNLDHNVHVRPSGRTSGFTSPFRFSSPSFLAQSRVCRTRGPSVSPDSMAEGLTAQSHTDTDCASNTSSLSATTPVHRSSPQSLDRVTTPPPSASHFHRNDLLSTNNGHCREDKDGQTTRLPPPKADRQQSSQAMVSLQEPSSLEDPVVLSLLRQNMREKNSRHISDLRAYYESEISILKEKLDLVNQSGSSMEKSNQSLLDRCDHLERSLMEARALIPELENKNLLLERQLAEWPERYNAIGDVVQALQQRLEDAKQSDRDKDALIVQLKARLRQLEDALTAAHRICDDKDAQTREKHKMLQDLFAEYESLGKDHERVKANFMSTENRLFDASAEISELTRMVSKLENQIKQLDHENLKTRHIPRSHSQPSRAGFYHHPDLLLSSCKNLTDGEGGRRKCPGTGADHTVFTGQSSDHYTADCDRSKPSQEREHTQEWPSGQEPTKTDGPLTPSMKALIQMEETRATDGRALCKTDVSPYGLSSRRPIVSFVENSGREPVQERSSVLLKAQRSLSPEGHRSSSMPPCTRRSAQTPTPVKRETMITPLSAKSSPKRCPSENYSTALGHSPPWHQLSNARTDVRLDQSSLVSSSPSHNSSAKKKLQFMSSEELEENNQQSGPGAEGETKQDECAMRSAMERQVTKGCEEEFLCPPEAPHSYHAQLQSLADTERLFDELTQEKQQIEAALCRIPATGGRVTLQAKLDEEALEDRLEKINRDLGSIRMTLKRFHVLRSSTNI